MKGKIFTAVLLSALLLTIPQPQIENSASSTKVQAVRVAAPEKADQKTQAEQQSVEPSQPPVTQAVAQSTNCADYTGIVSQYNWNVKVALAIMRAESGCNPNATNWQNYDGSVDRGLFQVNSIHSGMVNGNVNALYDATTNIRVAYAVYTGSGWSAWSVYNSGAYARYL